MTRRALCIGINDYPGTGSDLSGCVNDARDWASELYTRGFEVESLTDAQATRAAMTSAILTLISNAQRGDTVVFTYSGHGTWVVDQDGDEVDGRDEALCPHDISTRGALLDDEIRQLFDRRGDVEGAVFHRRQDEFAGVAECGTGDVLLPGADDDFVDAARSGFARFAEAAGQAGEVLQLEGDVFEDVRRPGAFLQATHEAAALAVAAAVLDQRGEHGLETVDKAGDGVRRAVLKLADVDDGFQNRTIGPDVRAAQIADFEELDVFRIHLLNIG